ncbi:tail protein [Acinetobacter phage vB_AbaM_Rocket]
MDNLDNGLELLSGKLVVLFLTYALALEACVNFPAGTRVKVTNDPNPDLNGEYTWDGTKLVKTTNNTLEKAKDEAEKLVDDKLETVLTPDKILDIISGLITESELDQHLRQRIDKIESVAPIIEDLKREADAVKKDLDEQLFFLESDYNNLKSYVTSLELEINTDFAGVKQQIQDLRDQVNADFQAVQQRIDQIQAEVEAKWLEIDADLKAAQDRIDAIQAEVDAKWIEVDQIKTDLNKEITDRIAAVRAETEARVADIRLLNDGLTKEIKERRDGDAALLLNIENYKTSNDAALANVREEIKVAVDTSNATAEKVVALDARVKVAEDNSGKALENSAAAVSKAQTAVDQSTATASRVDSLEADVIKAVDDSGIAIKNSATALQQSQAAVDKATATANQVTIVEAKLNTKNSTYRQNTAPTKTSHPNLTEGDIWINPAAKNEQKRWNGTAWVDINDVRVGENATAISKLESAVKTQGDTITAVSTKVDSLEASIGDMATSEALEQLKTTVVKQGTDIVANADKIVALETTVGKNQEANSKALQDLNTRVDKTDEKVAANASAITSLNSTVNASLNAVNITADLDLDKDVTYYLKSGEIAKAPDDAGTTQRVIKIGNNAGNDTLWMHPNTFLPYDPDVMYKVRAKVRRAAGSGVFYIGIAAKNADKTKYVTTANALVDDMNSSSYLVQANTATMPVGQWVEFEWYIKGRSTGSALLPPTYGTVDKPVQLPRQAGYVSPMLIANYGNLAGIVDVAYVVLETAEAYKAISANANALTSLKTDVQKNADGIKAVGEAVTNVEASVKNMDIGGQNLWTIYNKQFVQSNTANAPYINLEWLSESEEWYKATLTKDIANYQHYFINIMADTSYPMVVGEDYTVSFEMRASKVAKIYQILAYFGGLSTIANTTTSTTTDWQTITLTAKANGTATNGSYQLFGFTMLKSEGWTTNDWYEVRRVQLQKGNKATRYQKAQAGLIAGIKANAQAFSTLNATVKTQGDTISSQGQAITGLDTRINNMDGVVQGQATAIDELKTTVKQQGDSITANSQAIVGLKSDIAGKADSKALQDLTTRVEKDEEKIASNASAITSLNSTVNASVNAINITADLDLTTDVQFWRNTGEVVKVDSGVGTTGRVIKLGDNNGNDNVWMHPKAMLPFDPDVMYKVRAKIRRVSGAGTIYVGVSAKNSTKTKYVTTGNTLADDMGSSIYLLSGSAPALGQWMEYEWYVKGRSTGAAVIPATNTPESPAQMPAQTGYFTPMVIGNYQSAAGEVEVAYVVLETAEAYKAITANANALTSLKTDVQKNADGIKAVGEAITNVEAGISNIDIGGQNLWTLWNKAPVQSNTADAPYLRIDWQLESEESYRATITKDTSTFQHYFVGLMANASYPIVVGEDYTVTFEMRASKVVKISQVLAYFGSIGDIQATGQSTSTEWKTYTFTAKSKGTQTAGSYQLFGFTLLKADGWALNDWYEVRRVQLQKGNKPTRYQKAQATLIDGIKANSQAFTNLSATVKTQGDTITSQGLAITGLRQDVDGKASAQALQELKNTVVTQGDAIASQGQAITSLDNTVKISAKAGTNLLINSNVVGTYDGVGYPHVVYNLGEDFEVGVQYSLIWCAEHKRGTGDTNSSLAVYAGGGSQTLQSVVNTNGKVVNRITFVKSSANLSPKNLNFYMINRPPASAGSVGTVYWAVLVKGPSVLTDVWIPSPYDYIPQATANANAITGLQTDVKANGDSIKIQAEQLTGVKATLGAHDTDSLALDYNTATPSVWESYYSYDMKQYFKTTTSGKIGPNVFRKDTTNPANCFNFNLSKIPNNRPYKVSFWVRRSADSTGRFEIPVRYVRADGSVSNIGGGYGTYPITPAIPNNEVWTLVEMVIDASKVADAPQIQFGIALGHTGTSGWSEMQGYKVSPVLNAGDMDATVATAEGLQNLKTTVDKNGADIKAQGLAITGLEAKIAGKADAQAVSELKATVDQQGKDITSNSQAITKVDSRVDGLNTGNLNLIAKGKWLNPAMSRVNQKDNYSFTLKDATSPFVDDWARFGTFPEFNVGTRYTFSFKIKVNDSVVTNVGGHINGFTAEKVLLDGVVVAGATYTAGTPIVIPNDSKFHTVTVIMNRTGADTGIYIQPNRVTSYDKAYDVTIKEVMLTEGNMQTGWTAPPDYLGDQVEASASALSGLTTEVSRIDGVVKTQGTDIVNIKTALGGKADASALQTLQGTVIQQGKDITANSQALTGLESNLNDVQASTGQNLIWNGDFTDGLNNWALNGTTTGMSVYDWTARGTKWGRYVSSDTTTQFKGIRQVVGLAKGLKPNMTYTLSFSAHGNAGSIDKNIGVIIHRTGSTSGNNQVSGGPFVTPAGVTRHSMTFNTDGITDLVQLNVIFYAYTGYAPDFFITEVQLEEGKVATGFKKSNTEMISGISANAQAVTQLQTTTKNQGDAITAQGKQITDISVRVNNMEKDNLLNPFKDATNTGNQYLQLSIPLKEPITIKTGEKISVRGKISIEHPNALTDAQGVAFYLEGSPRFTSIPLLKQGPDQMFEGTLIVPDINNGRVISNLNVYFYPSGTAVATTKVTLHWAELFRGESIIGGTASAVQSLSATVTQNGKDIVSQGQAITQLKSSVNTLEGQMGQKADASALNNYYTKAQADTAIAGRITEFSSSLIIGGDNVLYNSEAPRSSTATSNREYLLYERSKELKAFYDQNLGQQISISFELSVPVAGTVQVYSSNGSAHIYTGSVVVAAADVGKFKRYELQVTPVAHGTTPNAPESTLEFYGVYGTGRIPTVRKVQVQAGNKATAWSPSPRDNTALLDGKITANTTAIGKVETRTATLEGTVETQGTDIRALQSKVNDPVKGIDATAIAMGKLDTRVKTTEDSIVAQGKSITQVEADLKNITAGGSNLLKNGNFASTPDLANWGNWGGTNATRSVTTISGKKWVRITANNTATFRGISQATPVNSFKRGVQYTITFTAQSVGATGGVQLVIHQTGDGSNDPQITPAVFPITNVAKRISHTFTSSTAAKTSFNVLIGPQNGVAGDIYLTDIMFTEGNVATAWSPSNDEINDGLSANAKAVSDLSVEVGKVDGRVTTVAKSVTTLEGKVGDNSAALETQGLVIDGLKVRWSVKADVNGMVSGVAMNNDGKTADFIIRANTFAIAPPTNANAGDVGKYAFVYKSTPQTLPNGTVIPAGLYVDSLMLGEIKAERINAQSISAISANLGTFETSVSGKGKTVISGTQYQVFDAAGVERIFLGVR